MALRRLWIALWVVGIAGAAAVFPAGCDAAAGGVAGLSGGERLEVNDSLRVTCGEITDLGGGLGDAEIEAILADMEEQRLAGASSVQAIADSLIICNTSPPGG